MTPDEYRAAIAELGLSQNAAGRFFGVHEVTGREWAKRGPPPCVSKFLRLMIALKFTPEYVSRVLGE